MTPEDLRALAASVVIGPVALLAVVAVIQGLRYGLWRRW